MRGRGREISGDEIIFFLCLKFADIQLGYYLYSVSCCFSCREMLLSSFVFLLDCSLINLMEHIEPTSLLPFLSVIASHSLHSLCPFLLDACYS